ncbi:MULTISPECIES: Ni/Fe-hydrogenase, b-type cytochrome subunit [Marichromatium]|uniref:Ni/Fe-hydrogenase 1 B-type cytochrome subunit n=1 Tax=Marichromatium gracile TaxID=1048 RepID=A0A4R4A9B0_MARGR|nr:MULTISPECIES: Ni/Fe-hydrogenase, b-type cytochrome subunit [Marichromatium]MBO8086389.1 Ni/Fe-hydrogenase, b-type cytochrome subunit [Marichromatium sp.]MBK1710289.1 Ni/Fe-hydrogenase, b-type cytochrome subunit [Marichromatium gracile]RNE88603.1 Ni/Fe-hydrogenase, b-type cytochrome subunit [Marichromatium sp. AB31]RNE92471.1 Ni/Fe-hydrogenase, b-type cytochrome subunit [Marichromatium sp. AB32]TCW35512.1 Ni/Fe-hydrogenase 1 B-type cytochrome subunit [Marichromatium gracile]
MLPDVPTVKQTAVYVYQAPVRVWHWVNALSILVLAVTGYLIGAPPPTLSGEASAHYLMGDIRFLHFAAAYVFAVGFLFRIYWALVGNAYSRQLFSLPFWRRRFWRELVHELRWYAFLEREPCKYIGHNPLAHLFMVAIITVGGLVMIVTGFALYAEQTGLGSWQDELFGWVIPWVGQSQDVRMWHHWGMWVIVVFVMLHVYTAIREDIMSRQSLISTMISGWRMFKDDRP